MKKAYLCAGILSVLLSGCAVSNQNILPSREIGSEVQEEGTTEKQTAEIVLQDYCGSVEMLQQLVDAFQDCNPDYKVRIVRKSQGMISGWKGIEGDLKAKFRKDEKPDLIYVQGVPERDFCETYCQSLALNLSREEFIGHVTDLNAVETGWLGIPATFSVDTMVISEEHGISSEEWSGESMMNLAEQGNYPGVVCGMNGYYAGNELRHLFGESLSEGEEEFVKEHSDTGDAKMTVGEIFSKEKALAFAGTIARLEDYLFMNALFEGKAEFVGFPSWQGGKSKLNCTYFCSVKGAKEHDGSIRFMEFAASREGQQVIQAYLEKVNSQAISARRDVVNDYLEHKESGNSFGVVNGVTIEDRGLTEDELTEFLTILESAE